MADPSTNTDQMTHLGSVHLVYGNDQLPDTKGEGEKGMLASLTVLGDTSFELTSTGGDNQNGAVGLGGTSDHILDEVTMPGSINDLGNVKRDQ